MQNINFETGLRSYSLNNDESKVIYFNPTDLDIATRFDKAISDIENYKAKEIDTKSDDVVKQASDAVSDFDEFIKKQIDYVLGNKVSDVVFNGVSPMSPVKGKPLYERFLDAVSEIITAEIGKENKAIAKRVSKYTDAVKGLK